MSEDDPIVGHKTWADGSHTTLRQSEAEELWAAALAAEAKRAVDMPTERDAIDRLWSAQQRLKELGWNDPVYAPKDGSPLDVIELGSTGIHRAHYDGEWPTGEWWIYDGDVWPCRPALARPALAAAASGGDVKQAPGEAPQSGPKGNAQPVSPNPSLSSQGS